MYGDCMKYKSLWLSLALLCCLGAVKTKAMPDFLTDFYPLPNSVWDWNKFYPDDSNQWTRVQYYVNFLGKRQTYHLREIEDGKQQELSAFLINSFTFIFGNPFQFLSIIAAILIFFTIGGSLIASDHKVLGWLFFIIGAIIWVYILTLVFFFLAMILGLCIGGFRKN